MSTLSLIPAPGIQSARYVYVDRPGGPWRQHIGTVRIIGYEKIDDTIDKVRGNIRPVWVAETISGKRLGGTFTDALEAAGVFA